MYVCMYVCAFLYLLMNLPGLGHWRLDTLGSQVRPMSSDNAPGSHGAGSGQGRSSHDPEKDFGIRSKEHLVRAFGACRNSGRA